MVSSYLLLNKIKIEMYVWRLEVRGYEAEKKKGMGGPEWVSGGFISDSSKLICSLLKAVYVVEIQVYFYTENL